MSASRVLGAYVAEARGECLRYMRNPGFMLPIMLFPTMFYLLFGIVMAKSEGADAARYLLASYGVFGVMSPGLFGFGVSLALERDGGLLTYKRALPMPPGAYLLGKMLMAMLAAALVILLLLVMGVFLAHVALTVQQAVHVVAHRHARCAAVLCARHVGWHADQRAGRAGLAQSGLSADVFPVGAVDSDADAAQGAAADRTDLAELSPAPASRWSAELASITTVSA
jgi:hypothetical protein